MKIVRTRTELREEIKRAKKETKSIGFVPTMGYLHQGHLSLMEKARKENELLIASIFVNPTQFGPNEDLASYPRNLEQDAKLAESVGVDIIFAPDEQVIYPDGFQTFVQVKDLTQTLCGAKRPGHFLGVCTVVTKLFNLVQPERAYFGQKDAQQVIVLRQMVRDLDLPIEIVTCPIVREIDGLAMSSRNKYLSDIERNSALVLNRSLAKAKGMIETGERDAAIVTQRITEIIKQVDLAQIDYVSIVSQETLQPIDRITGNVLIALAVFIGQTRLIDNLMMEVY